MCIGLHTLKTSWENLFCPLYHSRRAGQTDEAQPTIFQFYSFHHYKKYIFLYFSIFIFPRNERNLAHEYSQKLTPDFSFSFNQIKKPSLKSLQQPCGTSFISFVLNVLFGISRQSHLDSTSYLRKELGCSACSTCWNNQRVHLLVWYEVTSYSSVLFHRCLSSWEALCNLEKENGEVGKK